MSILTGYIAKRLLGALHLASIVVLAALMQTSGATEAEISVTVQQVKVLAETISLLSEGHHNDQ